MEKMDVRTVATAEPRALKPVLAGILFLPFAATVAVPYWAALFLWLAIATLPRSLGFLGRAALDLAHYAGVLILGEATTGARIGGMDQGSSR